MTTRAYCVIPHGARQDTSFFQGVFEDGVRVLHQGRLQSFVFAHVLSPAHDYVKHINGPLLATLREGGNATLVLASPNSEDMGVRVSATVRQGSNASEGSGSTREVTTPTTSSSPCLLQDSRSGLAEATAVAMELYTNLFPLIFRNVAGCQAVRLSVVTVSATERVLLDNLKEHKRISMIQEAHYVTIHRDTSASEWGTVLQLLEDRHMALEESPTALEGQTACTVTVDLQGYGRLVVVDTASAQNILQQLTLILNMQRQGKDRSYPLHTPLRDLLDRNVAPRATVQLVCVPAPQSTRRQSMRVLHFGASVEGSGNDDGANLSSATIVSSMPQHQRLHSVGPGSSKFFASPALSTSLTDLEPKKRRTTDDAGVSSAVKMRSSSPQMQAEVLQTGQSSSGENQESSQEKTPVQLPPPNVTHEVSRQRGSEDLLMKRIASLEAQLRDAEGDLRRMKTMNDNAEQKQRDTECKLRDTMDDRTHLQRALEKSKEENAEYTRLVKRLQQQARTLEQEASRQKRQGVTLVKQMRGLETEKAALNSQLMRLRREVMLSRKNATRRARESTLARIIPYHMLDFPGETMEQRESQQKRSGARIGAASLGTSGIPPPSVSDVNAGRRLASRARRLDDSASESEHETASEVECDSSHAPPQERLMSITVDELRWRNGLLEQEVNRLQKRLLTALASSPQHGGKAVAPPQSSEECPNCSSRQERVKSLVEELGRNRAEKEVASDTHGSPHRTRASSLVDAMAARSATADGARSEVSGSVGGARMTSVSSTPGCSEKNDTPDAANVIQCVCAALLTGCISLESQLAVKQATLAQRQHGTSSCDQPSDLDEPPLSEPASKVTPLVLQEHRDAVAALAVSLRQIAQKPASGPCPTAGASPRGHRKRQNLLPPVPRCATAANVATLTDHLSFEVERCRHLRAFIPTFAQLAIATEHLSMRLEMPE